MSTSVRDLERILIVRLSHLGDVVSCLGVFHTLRTAYPRAEIAWAVQPEFAELVEGLPGLARTIRFDRRGGWRAWPRIARELRSFAADLAVDVQGNAKSALVTLLSRAPRRAGYARRDWQERWASVVVNEPAPPRPADERHPLERARGLVEHLLGARERVSEAWRTDAALDEQERARGVALLEENLPADARNAANGRGDGPLVLCHLSSPEDVRGWPTAHWAELIEGLVADGARVCVLSGAAEADLGRSLAARLPAGPRLAHWIGQRGLRELAAAFEAAAQRGARLVACDSGPMHLAAASGLGVVVLEGPQDARRTGPFPLAGEATFPLVQPTPGPPLHVAVTAGDPPACAPCLRRRCDHPEGPLCMTNLRPAAVQQALWGVARS